jgi:hypothetical protein
VDLTGKTGGKLDFQLSFDTEVDWDFAFVEAHTPGQDDWTTLRLTDDTDAEVTSDYTGLSCNDGDGSTWHEDHPFLLHYQTFDNNAPDGCLPTGTTGEWHAVNGNSNGWQHVNGDLSAYDGQAVEVSITYVTDPAVQGLGVLLDDVRVSAGDEVLSETSFEDGLGVWTVPGPPEGTDFNSSDWTRLRAAFDETPVIQTPDSIWMTFGLEGVDTDENRNALLREALEEFGVLTPPQPTPTETPTEVPTETPTETPTPSPTTTPEPEPETIGVVLGTGTVRVSRGRNATVRFSCVSATAKRCAGDARLFRKEGQIAGKKFNAPVGSAVTRKLKLSKRTYRKLRRRGRLGAKYEVQLRGQEPVSVRVTLKPKLG